MEQLLHNLSSVLPENDGVCSAGDLVPNVEDIMQVIKSIEGSERLNNSANDLNSEGEEIFPMAGTDLTNNLSSFEKELLENVDVMNMTIEDQQDELDSVANQKESQANEVLVALQKKHAKVERRLDFLNRRVYKLQSRFVGQHVSSEIAGVFENVHRLLKKPKESFEEPLLLGSMRAIETKPVEKLKPMSYSSAKTLVRKLEMSTVLQANTIARQKTGPKYFGSGSIEIPPPRNNTSGAINIIPWPIETKNELQKVAGQLKIQTSVTQKFVDSEATESSSGGESCDEMQNYNNPHQQYLSVQKRALWKYSTDRSVIAARWTWLQAQIQDLEYRIRQHTDLHKQIRLNKGAVQLGGASPPLIPTALSSQTIINGYRGQLPGSSVASKMAEDVADGTATDYQCARTRPLVIFKKRKLLQISGLHAVSRKAARPSTIRCGCVPLTVPCAVCTGRTDPTHPRDPPDTMSRSEKVSVLDPSFHPVFSLPEDTSQKIHFEAVMKTQEWQQRSTRMKSYKVLSKSERMESKSLEHRTRKLEHRKKYGRMLKPSTISALSAKIRNKIRGRKPGRHPLNKVYRKRHDNAKETEPTMNSPIADYADEEVESIGNNSNLGPSNPYDSPSSSPLLHMHSISGYKKNNRSLSYDIDNIVIPYSVAAATRVEKLQYKEIMTPKWRIAEPDFPNEFETKNNGAVKDTNQDSDVEDLSEEATIGRHDRCEYDEKKRFLSYLKFPLGYGRTRVNKRTDSRAESSGANTPDPMSPHNNDQLDVSNSPMTSPPATPLPTHQEESTLPVPLPSLPSIAVMRRRTMSQSRFAKEKEFKDEAQGPAPDVVEVPPFERRTFPINDETYEKMLQHMPENHQFQTNTRSQDSAEYEALVGYMDQKADSPDSESTESAIGEGEEDPNDPEWIDMERINRDRYKR
ncbi:hypothetical protein JTB14_025113 [Gonioctena quinquepunctata]|nr:hypothetical protein JTB14_025113 [Gonioctena quinquepunctata]